MIFNLPLRTGSPKDFGDFVHERRNNTSRISTPPFFYLREINNFFPLLIYCHAAFMCSCWVVALVLELDLRNMGTLIFLEWSRGWLVPFL